MSSVEDRLLVRMEASLRTFERQMERARQKANTTATSVEKRFTQMGNRMGQTSTRGAAGLTRLLNISGRGRFVLQNTAAQFGDIAIQLESGTNAMRVMGQQVPQVLGAFGALGGALGIVGPLLSTVAAIGFPIAAMFLLTGDKAEDSADKIETFADALKETQGALASAEAAMAMASAGGLDDLEKKYGIVTRKVTELADALAAIQGDAARMSMGQLLDFVLPVEGSLEQVRQAAQEYDQMRARLVEVNAELMGVATMDQGRFDALDAERVALEGQLAVLGPIRAQFEAIADTMGLLPEDAGELAVGLAEARAAISAGDFEAAADVLSAMRDVALEMGLTLADEVVANITQAESEARELALTFGDGEGAAGAVAGAAAGITSEVGAAANEAQRLAGNLAAALAVLGQVASGMAAAQRRAAAEIRIKRATIGDPVGRAGQLARMEFNEKSGAAAYALIRGGQASRLKDLGNEIEAGARDIAAAGEALDKAEKAFRETVRASRSGGRSGGGGSGGRSRTAKAEKDPLEGFFDASEQEILTLQRKIEMIGKTDREVATLTARYKLLDAARKRGLDVDARQVASGLTVRQEIDRQAEAIGRLATKYDAAADQAEFFGAQQKAVEAGLIDAIVEGENFAGVLENVAKSLAKAALQASLFGSGPLAGRFGTQDGGVLSGLFDGIFGMLSRGGARAGGGGVMAGRAYPVNENTRNSEIFVPSRSGAILNTMQAQRALGAGGGDVQVHIHENAADGAHRVSQSPGRVDVFLRKAVSDMIEGGQLDGAMRRFGAAARPRGA
jgi:hypothetical protein